MDKYSELILESLTGGTSGTTTTTTTIVGGTTTTTTLPPPVFDDTVYNDLESDYKKIWTNVNSKII